MWLISFRYFKENCIHVKHDYDFNKTICTMQHNNHEIFTVDLETKREHLYCPCKEKYCPVLQACKRGK